MCAGFSYNMLARAFRPSNIRHKGLRPASCVTLRGPPRNYRYATSYTYTARGKVQIGKFNDHGVENWKTY